MIRLDRFLSKATALSRSQASKAIRAGRVTVDGKPARQASVGVAETARVCLDGGIVAPPLPRYFMLHKPPGVVCASEDPTHRTAIDLLNLPNPEGLHFAGRLDVDATGLVLITDDGHWSHGIVAPARHRDKTYRVGLAQALPEAQAQRLREGILLRGEARMTRPARLECLSPEEWLITLSEGRYHQVKRMFAALGNRVIRLHRESIGGLSLDPELQAGAYRPLTQEEVALLS